MGNNGVYHGARDRITCGLVAIRHAPVKFVEAKTNDAGRPLRMCVCLSIEVCMTSRSRILNFSEQGIGLERSFQSSLVPIMT